ncbi:hypothetical protein [Undibacterium sp. Di24W]|uniref:hypothetical protein n=1 Tax=Undibacterium sp. Di24W TaxID=3413033 RepID=UPI003BF263E5
MSFYRSKISFNNQRNIPLVIVIEPWGEDYSLMPGEQLELLAYGRNGTPWFHVVEWDDSSQVYCEDADSFKVVQQNVELKCGHNRQEVWDG